VSTKTGIVRRYAIEPALPPLLRAMRAESRGAGRVAEMGDRKPWGGEPPRSHSTGRRRARRALRRPRDPQAPHLPAAGLSAAIRRPMSKRSCRARSVQRSLIRVRGARTRRRGRAQAPRYRRPDQLLSLPGPSGWRRRIRPARLDPRRARPALFLPEVTWRRREPAGPSRREP